MKEALKEPLDIDSASRAMEMARIWIVDGKQKVILSANLWRDPRAWGLMLVDLAKHVSLAYKDQGHDADEVMIRIKEAFDVEWQHSTTTLE